MSEETVKAEGFPEITQQEIYDLFIKRGLTIEKVIDVIIDTNHIIGVGLITLGDTIREYACQNKKLRETPITEKFND